MDSDSPNHQPPPGGKRRWNQSRVAIAVGYLLVAVALTAALQNRRIPDPVVYRLEDVIGANAAAGPSGARIYFLFQAHDCRDQLHAITILNDLHQSPAVRVAGFVLDAGAADEWEDLVHQSGITFPVFSLREKQIHRSIRDLGYWHTPLIILSDKHRRVRGVLPGVDLRREEVENFLLNLMEDTGDAA